MNNYIVYVLEFPNNKYYVGMTQQNPKRRWKAGAGYNKCQPVKQAIYEFGWKNVKHIILQQNLSKQQAEYYEQYYIKQYQSNNIQFGFNLTSGGIKGTTRNNSSNNKTSISRKGIKFSDSHRNNLSKSLHKYFSDTNNKDNIEKMKYTNVLNSPRRKAVKCLETGTIYPSCRNAGKLTNIDYRQILKVCHKQKETAGGLHWEFMKESDD